MGVDAVCGCSGAIGDGAVDAVGSRCVAPAMLPIRRGTPSGIARGIPTSSGAVTSAIATKHAISVCLHAHYYYNITILHKMYK